MGILTTVQLAAGTGGARAVVPMKVGAVHKLSTREKVTVRAWALKDGGGSGKGGKGGRGGRGDRVGGAVVVAGDQKWEFCDSVGLRHVDNKKHDTVPVVTCNAERKGLSVEPHFSSGFDAKRRHRVRSPLALNFPFFFDSKSTPFPFQPG